MNKIHLLDETVANKIAAGEVVENPASVVKELVENAIDAHASRIDITIQAGGVQLIRVSDNGHGMSPDDARLSLKRYATSKIKEAEDLEKINSFGFRGEALPSIAAISRFRLITKTVDVDEGFEIDVAGGKVQSQKIAARATGTTIEVADLFYNTPARKKFLRTEKYEKALIADLLTALALSHPEISFQFQEGGNISFSYAATDNWLERARQIFGAEFEEMVPIEEKRNEFHCYGLISKPSLQRTNKSRQYFFINQRFVRFPRLSFVLQEAYQGYLVQGRFPYALLFIHADPQLLDVNVHPQKQTVKIHNEKSVNELVYHLVRKTLVEIENPSSTQATSALSSEKFSPFSQKPTPDFSAFSGSKKNDSYAPSSFTSPAKTSVSEPLLEKTFAGYATKTSEAKTSPASFDITAIEAFQKFGILQILGQMALTYLVCEGENELILIDQHAAHERIMFEQLCRSFTAANPISQTLLFPITLELSFEEQESLESLLPSLNSFGFQIQFLGKTTFAIYAYPSLFHKEDLKEIVLSVVTQFQETSQKQLFADATERVAALMACKAKSVKAGQKLTHDEMRELVISLAACNNPMHCCHGRPTFLHLPASELERRFLRKL